MRCEEVRCTAGDYPGSRDHGLQQRRRFHGGHNLNDEDRALTATCSDVAVYGITKKAQGRTSKTRVGVLGLI